MSTKETGNTGEKIAAKFLEGKGFAVLARNWKRKLGELDIVAQKGSTIHFVEVKSISVASGDVSRVTKVLPEELAHPMKIAKVARLAELYMAEGRLTGQYQIDVVAVYLDYRTKRAVCKYYPQVL